MICESYEVWTQHKTSQSELNISYKDALFRYQTTTSTSASIPKGKRTSHFWLVTILLLLVKVTVITRINSYVLVTANDSTMLAMECQAVCHSLQNVLPYFVLPHFEVSKEIVKITSMSFPFYFVQSWLFTWYMQVIRKFCTAYPIPHVFHLLFILHRICLAPLIFRKRILS